MLERCALLEARAAAVYRTYAAAARHEPALCALWTSLAREEEEHARSLVAARRAVDPATAQATEISGWDDVLADVEAALAAAERSATLDRNRQLVAALELEATELESLRHLALQTAGAPLPRGGQAAHAARLAEAASRLSDDPRVGLQAAVLRARARLVPPA